MRKQLLGLAAAGGIAFGALGVFSAQPAEAAVFNPTCSVASLRANLASAALLGGPHAVVLPQNCVYSFSNTALTNPDSALPAITRNVVIFGNGSTFERAPGAPAMRFLEVRAGANLAIRNITMTGGSNPAADGLVIHPDYAGEANGGAIRCTGGGLILDAVGLSGNEAQNGGGLFAEDCNVVVTDSYVTKNIAAGGDGGGMLVTTVNAATSLLAVDGGHIWDNAADADGGGVLAEVHDFRLAASEVLRNDAAGNGGGVHLTTFNTPSEGITFSTVADNVAGGDGGGMYMAPFTNGSIGVNFSTVSGNSATNGGGLVMAYGGIHRTSVSGNSAAVAGGGLLTNWATVTLHRATLADNVSAAGIGNAIGGWGAIYPINSLVAHTGAAPAGTLCDETAGLGLYPLYVGSMSEGTCLGFVAIAAGSAGLQPLLGNGGTTTTHALGAGSVAIDAGDQPSCDSALWMGDHDQRGLPFVMTSGAACDVGSFEVQ